MQTQEYQKLFQLEDKHWWFVSKRAFIKVIFEKLNLKLDSKILDIGCGTGRNLRLLGNYGQATGVDYSSLAVKYCHQRGLKSVQKASAEKLPFKKNSFNLVTLFDVLYHQGIKSDLEVLKEVNRVLKPNEFILVTDCAHQWLFGPHDIAQHARQRYSKKELEVKLKKAGFKVIRSSYIFSSLFPIFILNRLINRHGSDVKPINQLVNRFLILIYRLEALVLRFINLPFGSSIIVLAQK